MRANGQHYSSLWIEHSPQFNAESLKLQLQLISLPPAGTKIFPFRWEDRTGIFQNDYNHFMADRRK